MARNHGQVNDGKTWCEGCRVWYRTTGKFQAHRCSGEYRAPVDGRPVFPIDPWLAKYKANQRTGL